MVNQIINVLPDLKPFRCLSTITYTNSACSIIKTRLQSQTPIPKNVFITTIHHFLNEAIIIPYASIYNIAGLEKMFIDLNLEDIVNAKAERYKKTPYYFAQKNVIKKRMTDKMLSEGKIPLSLIGNLASELMEIKIVREIVSLKYQFLFIDEFQDVDPKQFFVFESIRKTNKTSIYAVGDPEQFIMSYTYRGQKTHSFSNIPINTWDTNKKTISDNFRSYKEIVDFTNLFNNQIQQVSQKGSNSDSSVNFINKLDIKEIIAYYQRYCSAIFHKNPSQVFDLFYLSYENKTFEPFADEFGIKPLNSERQNRNTAFDNCLDLILHILGKTKHQAFETHNLDELQLRKLCIKIIDQIKQKTITNMSQIIDMLHNCGLAFEASEYFVVDNNKIQKIFQEFYDTPTTQNNHYFSSIHKAKGLEADAVLVIANTTNELTKWINTNQEERSMDKIDACRIGYVAFSRAKQILFISCLQQVDASTISKLEEFNVKIH